MDPNPGVTPRVSVCLAAYNGATHIEEQIKSILSELDTHDELIVVDDKSTDDTVEVVRSIQDDRVRIFQAAVNAGYVRTFERALSEAHGEFVFLSDQDDIWISGRVEAMISAMNGKDMVASNCKHFDGALGKFHELRLRAKDSEHSVRNVIGIVVGYRLHWGCAMAVRNRILNQILPFPQHMAESHDQWIAMVGNVNRSIAYFEADTILHRLHGENLTPLGIRSASKIIRARVAFIRNVFEAVRRARRAARAA
ncbi:glycosyltransferase involved in cell wall biosynthesis [Pseudarthrobacter siccitolerans]|uniref:Glycosyltransferase involved in cell wall biosynthesis n=1 Tax=Pseudarthrobacter siccitolerans TaxID=861266 RepID=A0ABU0PHK9_9MICC|nr:glycosyltransferase [Pseudarthrobacter siccitolerans]MDQ0673455.1 glycosyltransferase involved in cell wall biosynthesis [Pseudarthrobacter siccitolerans]